MSKEKGSKALRSRASPVWKCTFVMFAALAASLALVMEAGSCERW